MHGKMRENENTGTQQTTPKSDIKTKRRARKILLQQENKAYQNKKTKYQHKKTNYPKWKKNFLKQIEKYKQKHELTV